jgi:hypothetical protein
MADRMVTFRMPVLLLLPVPAGVATVGVMLLFQAAARHSAPAGSAGLGLSVLGLWTLIANSFLRVQLGPAGIRIWSLRQRSRLVRWDQIRTITVEPYRGARRVTLWTLAGRRIPLPLPISYRGRYEAALLHGYHQIGQYWQAIQQPGRTLPGC